jgi:hypothetical protein
VRTLQEEFKHNFQIVKEAFAIREFNRSLIFFLLIALCVPRFDDFLYYFKTEQAGFSQFTYSILTLVGTLCLVAGVLIYQRWY